MGALSIDEKAFRVMTKQWMTARAIWQLVDEGAYSTCKDGVVRLWKAGRNPADERQAVALPARDHGGVIAFRPQHRQGHAGPWHQLRLALRFASRNSVNTAGFSFSSAICGMVPFYLFAWSLLKNGAFSFFFADHKIAQSRREASKLRSKQA